MVDEKTDEDVTEENSPKGFSFFASFQLNKFESELLNTNHAEVEMVKDPVPCIQCQQEAEDEARRRRWQPAPSSSISRHLFQSSNSIAQGGKILENRNCGNCRLFFGVVNVS